VLRNSPSRVDSVFGYDRSERCFLSCTSGTVQTEPAHCGVTSPGASAPNLVNTRMPKKLGRGPRARRVSRFSSNQKTSKTQFMAHTRLLPAARAQKRCHAGGEKYRNVGLTSLTCAPVKFFIVFGVWTYFSHSTYARQLAPVQFIISSPADDFLFFIRVRKSAPPHSLSGDTSTLGQQVCRPPSPRASRSSRPRCRV
jgi:hypothetical protein